MFKKLGIISILLILFFTSGVNCPKGAEGPADRMKWWQEARFGMFIHWGVYSVPADGEWFLENRKMPVSEYEKFAGQFNPVKFNAAEWVRITKDAGMKYIVITSKHHDGFGMFRSGMTDWCLRSAPFERDPLEELAAACKEEGIRLCFYYSILDWHHPDYGVRRPWNDVVKGAPDMDRYVNFMKGQLKELLTNYGPIGVLWFDGGWEKAWTRKRGEDLYKYARGLQPDIIINDRGSAGDFTTPEQNIPSTGSDRDWESCMTINNNWGYSKNDRSWKSAKKLIRNLVDCASKGGNYLLNVGPDAEGVISGPSIERLSEIGRWLKVNGESVYGTSRSPFPAWSLPSYVKCTRKGKILYIHCYYEFLQENEEIILPLRNKVLSAKVLVTGEKINFRKDADGMHFLVPEQPVDKNDTVFVVEIEGEPDILPTPPIRPDPDGNLVLPAKFAVLHGSTAVYEYGKGKNNIGYWVDPKDWVSWDIEIDRAGTYGVEIEWACEPGAAGSSYKISVEDKSLQGAVEPTKSWTDFKSYNLGQIELTPGRKRLEVRPVTMPHGAVGNLRAVILKRF